MNYLYLLVLVTCIVQLVLVFTKVDKSTRQLICGITTLTIVWLFTTSDSLQIPTLLAILGGIYCIIYPNFKKCWIALGGYTICLCLIYLMNHTMEGYQLLTNSFNNSKSNDDTSDNTVSNTSTDDNVVSESSTTDDSNTTDDSDTMDDTEINNEIKALITNNPKYSKIYTYAFIGGYNAANDYNSS